MKDLVRTFGVPLMGIGLVTCLAFQVKAQAPDDSSSVYDESAEEIDLDADFDESEWESMDAEASDDEFVELDAADGVLELSGGVDESLQPKGSFYRLSPYYSSVGQTWSLTDDASVNVVEAGEWEVYGDLLKQSLRPEFLTMEFSVYPLPLLGVAIKDNWPGAYDDLDFGDDSNLIESVTAGFDEPYSASLLLSNISVYSPDDEGASDAPNVGFMGYLLSVGGHHIFRNELINDVWYELEWKAKGSVKRDLEAFDWGMRLGIKNHENDDITDTLYLALERSQVREGGSLLSLSENTGYELSYIVSRHNLAPVEASAFITRYFPIKGESRFVPALSIGVVQQWPRKYSRAFQAEYGEVDRTVFAIRPTLKF